MKYSLLDIVQEVSTRVCNKCGKEKPLTEFNKNKQCKLGRTGVNLMKKDMKESILVDLCKKIVEVNCG